MLNTSLFFPDNNEKKKTNACDSPTKRNLSSVIIVSFGSNSMRAGKMILNRSIHC